MSKLLILLFPYLVLVHKVNSANTLDFNTWSQTVGNTPVPSPTSLNVQYIPPAGSSIITQVQNEGMFCVYVIPTTDTGVVMSIRAKTGEPANTHLMEFVFAASLNAQNKIVANLWDSSNVNLITNNQINLPNSANAYYCLSWKIGGKAIWYVDGVAILHHSIEDFTLPLLPEIITYTVGASWFLNLYGPYTLAQGQYATWLISNGYLSSTQDILPPQLNLTSTPPTLIIAPTPSSQPTVSLLAPSFQPTTRPTHRPTPNIPTATPSTEFPSSCPSLVPTSSAPTISPSRNPTSIPSRLPSIPPTSSPFRKPTTAPATSNPIIQTPFSTAWPTLVPTLFPTRSVDILASGAASSTGLLVAGIIGPIVFILFIAAITYKYCFKRVAYGSAKSHKGPLGGIDSNESYGKGSYFTLSIYHKSGKIDDSPRQQMSMGFSPEKSTSAYASVATTPSDTNSSVATTPSDFPSTVSTVAIPGAVESLLITSPTVQKRRFSRQDNQRNSINAVAGRSSSNLLSESPENQV